MPYCLNRTCRAALWNVITSSLLIVPVIAQNQPPSSANTNSATQTVNESATVLKSTTRLVVVDVVATDKKGRAVTDLQSKDFRIFEKGHEQQLRDFSFQGPGAAATAQPASSATPSKSRPERPANVFTNVPSYKTDSALNIVMLDGLNTNELNQMQVREAMVKLLAKLPAGRPVAVYLLGQQLQLLQDFTSDPTLLQTALNNFKTHSAPLLDNPTGGIHDMFIPPAILSSIPPNLLERIKAFIEEQQSSRTDLRVNYTLDALHSLARAMAGYPGRKNLIWVSESFPLAILPETRLGAITGRAQRNYGGELARTADALINAQIAVYAIDIRGVSSNRIFEPENTNDAFGGRYTSTAVRNQEMDRDSDEWVSSHNTMTDLADQTGGRAYYNKNDFQSLVLKSMEDGANYYTLAYYPADKKWDGKFRKIEVKVDRPGVTLRYRLGYFAAEPASYARLDSDQRARDFGQALNLDYPSSTALLFEASVQPPSEKTGNKVLVNFAIDPHGVAFDKGDDGLQHATVDCAVEVYSEKGKTLKTEAETINADLKPDIYKQVMDSHLPCRESFDLAPGNYFLRIGVRDDHTGLIGSANARLTVEKRQ